MGGAGGGAGGWGVSIAGTLTASAGDIFLSGTGGNGSGSAGGGWGVSATGDFTASGTSPQWEARRRVGISRGRPGRISGGHFHGLKEHLPQSGGRHGVGGPGGGWGISAAGDFTASRSIYLGGLGGDGSGGAEGGLG